MYGFLLISDSGYFFDPNMSRYARGESSRSLRSQELKFITDFTLYLRLSAKIDGILGTVDFSQE